MSQRETMKLLAAQEAAQWEEEESKSQEGQIDLLSQLARMGQQMKELDARQARIENQLIKLLPSVKKAEQQFATIVLAGKELLEEMIEHRKDISASLTQYKEQVTTTAVEIKGEFQHQLQMLQVFFDETMKISDKNEEMVTQCQNMVATSSGVYQKGSAGVLEISEKTQAHLKATAEGHRKEIEAQAHHFKMIYRRLSKLIFIGAIVILMCAFAAGTMAVDQVIETLWSGTSAPNGVVDQSTGSHIPKGDAKETANYPKQPDIATPAKMGERETLSSQSLPQLKSVKSQIDSPRVQGPSQGKQDKYEEHGRHGGSEPSR